MGRTPENTRPSTPERNRSPERKSPLLSPQRDSNLFKQLPHDAQLQTLESPAGCSSDGQTKITSGDHSSKALQQTIGETQKIQHLINEAYSKVNAILNEKSEKIYLPTTEASGAFKFDIGAIELQERKEYTTINESTSSEETGEKGKDSGDFSDRKDIKGQSLSSETILSSDHHSVLTEHPSVSLEQERENEGIFDRDLNTETIPEASKKLSDLVADKKIHFEIKEMLPKDLLAKGEKSKADASPRSNDLTSIIVLPDPADDKTTLSPKRRPTAWKKDDTPQKIYEFKVALREQTGQDFGAAHHIVAFHVLNIFFHRGLTQNQREILRKDLGLRTQEDRDPGGVGSLMGLHAGFFMGPIKEQRIDDPGCGFDGIYLRVKETGETILHPVSQVLKEVCEIMDEHFPNIAKTEKKDIPANKPLPDEQFSKILFRLRAAQTFHVMEHPGYGIDQDVSMWHQEQPVSSSLESGEEPRKEPGWRKETREVTQEEIERMTTLMKKIQNELPPQSLRELTRQEKDVPPLPELPIKGPDLLDREKDEIDALLFAEENDPGSALSHALEFKIPYELKKPHFEGMAWTFMHNYAKFKKFIEKEAYSEEDAYHLTQQINREIISASSDRLDTAAETIFGVEQIPVDEPDPAAEAIFDMQQIPVDEPDPAAETIFDMQQIPVDEPDPAAESVFGMQQIPVDKKEKQTKLSECAQTVVNQAMKKESDKETLYDRLVAEYFQHGDHFSSKSEETLLERRGLHSEEAGYIKYKIAKQAKQANIEEIVQEADRYLETFIRIEHTDVLKIQHPGSANGEVG